MREARGAGGDVVEAQELVGPVGMGNAHRGAAGAIGVTADAFVGNVQMLAITVEELPQRP